MDNQNNGIQNLNPTPPVTDAIQNLQTPPSDSKLKPFLAFILITFGALGMVFTFDFFTTFLPESTYFFYSILPSPLKIILEINSLIQLVLGVIMIIKRDTFKLRKFAYILIAITFAIVLIIPVNATNTFVPLLKEATKSLPTISISPSPTPNPTFNWKTIANKKYGYSIKIPVDMDVISAGVNNVLPEEDSEIIVCQKCTTTNYENFPNLYLRAYELDLTVDKDKSLDVLANENYNANLANKYTFISLVKPIQKIELDGNQAFTYTIKSKGYSGKNNGFSSNNGENKIIETLYKGRYFIFIFDNDTKFNQIFSTFKFTDSQTVDSSNWKTYTGNEYSFKYPNDYVIKPKDSYTLIVATPGAELFAIQKEQLAPQQTKNYLGLPTIGQTTINGNTWTIVSGMYGDMLSYAKRIFVYQLIKNDVRYSFQFLNNTSTLTSIENQILSSFKFTDSQTSSSPTPTCIPRPACLDATPRCMIAEPASGWCR